MKSHYLITALCATLFCTQVFAENPKILVQATKDTVHIEADYHVHGKTLALFNVSPAENLPLGQAAFVKNLVVKDSKGKTLSAKPTADGDWILSAGDRTVHVSYDLELSHDKYHWPAGKEEVAYRTDEGLFFTGYALFIVPADKMDTDIDVRFELPQHWQAHTPWQKTDEHSFKASTRRELLSNAFFLGQIHHETLLAGDYQLDLVLGAPYIKDREKFTQLLKGTLDFANHAFQRSPRRKTFLIIVNEGDSDGGAFEGRFSQLIKGAATEQNRVIWGNTMAHELLHFWNGLSLIPSTLDEEWFKEGFTDYLTAVSLFRTGVFGEAWFFKRLETMYTRQVIGRMYQRADISLQQAGHNKHAMRALVYGGGAAVAIAIEAEMRTASNGKYGVEDLMRSLLTEFAESNKTYTLNDITRHIAQLSGKDMSDFFKRHVVGGEYIHLPQYVSLLGLSLDTFAEEAYISQAVDASAEAKQRFTQAYGVYAKQ